MKNWLLSFCLLFFASCLTGCCDDETEKEESEKTEIDHSLIEGEWCLQTSVQITDLTFNIVKFTGTVYQDWSTTPVEYETISGNWGYLPANNSLMMDTYHSSIKQSISHNYAITAIDEYKMQLRNKETGAEDNYYRVVETKNLKPGDETALNFAKEHSLPNARYESSNESIASVDSEGNVKANAAGIAFITVLAGQITVKTKVTIN